MVLAFEEWLATDELYHNIVMLNLIQYRVQLEMTLSQQNISWIGM